MNAPQLSLQELKEQLLSVCDHLLHQESKLQHDLQNYQNVSLVKNLDKQILEKNNYIKVVERQLRILKKKLSKKKYRDQETQTEEVTEEVNNIVSSEKEIEKESSEEEEEEEADSSSEEDISIYQKTINGISYYIEYGTHQVYQIEDDDEIGDCIGVLRNSTICPLTTS